MVLNIDLCVIKLSLKTKTLYKDPKKSLLVKFKCNSSGPAAVTPVLQGLQFSLYALPQSINSSFLVYIYPNVMMTTFPS